MDTHSNTILTDLSPEDRADLAQLVDLMRQQLEQVNRTNASLSGIRAAAQGITADLRAARVSK